VLSSVCTDLLVLLVLDGMFLLCPACEVGSESILGTEQKRYSPELVEALVSVDVASVRRLGLYKIFLKNVFHVGTFPGTQKRVQITRKL